MYCKYCGKMISDDATFCSCCGKPQNHSEKISSGLKIDKLTNQTINENVCVVLTIVLSALTLITYIMPWLVLEAGIFGSEQMSALWVITNMFRDSPDDGSIILWWVLTLFAIIAAIMHIITIFVAATKRKGFLSNGITSGILTLVLSILVMIIILVLKMQAEQEWGGASSFFHFGIGLVSCFVLSILEMACCYRLSGNITGDELKSDRNVVCADCGTQYVRITAATVCPNCGSYHYKSDNSSLDDSILCAYCGNRFMKKGALAKCPRCGRVQPQRANKLFSGALVCPHCKYVNPKGSVFCSNCNAQIGEKKKAGENVEYVFCVECGEKILSTASICPYCNKQQEEKMTTIEGTET